ncbi:DUF1254 domain-containing protein [Sinorhizobium meliloti]|uniref:DUF1254 domain-containing protein n=1 Tax=Rhizobium meliloti TaxID=382 RepID=UPI000FDA1821|nr:DUF1254 domain-containing protein [Sinorhizobium meliloti]RVI64085.1 DUF1254 domain-containing protein [Sinorhizobium meliloti]
MKPLVKYLLGAFAAACFSTAAAAQDLTPAQVRPIARDAYVYGVPMVSFYGTIYLFNIDKTSKAYRGPFNVIPDTPARVFTPEDTAFVTPNSDTPYTFITLDLRAEPMVITLPAMEKDRYFVFQMLDLFTFNFAYLGSRTTGNGGGKYLIAGPTWKGDAPAGIDKVIRSETQILEIVGRTQLFNAGDLANVAKIQAEYKLQPLSDYLGTQPLAAPTIDWFKPLPPAQQRTSVEFFNELAFLLQFAEPPNSSEVALRKEFERIGIVPGKPLNVASLSPEMKAAFEEGMKDGQKLIDAYRAKSGSNTDDLFGTRAFLENDYVRRAAGTQFGIGANSKEEALYPVYAKDTDGQPLNGVNGRYTLRYAAGDLPPVNAFWSLTMYDLPDQLLVKNPINRYLINSPMLPGLKRDSDGGLTLYIQSDSPGPDKEANWLPAPKGPFMMVARYYWPKPEVLDGKWKSPPLQGAK